MPTTHALIMAAGTGERFGRGEAKQYVPLDGRPMLVWSLECFANHDGIDAVTVVVTAGEEERVRQVVGQYNIGKLAGIVAGGDTRQQSVRQGVEVVADSCDNILVHDAARPCVSAALIGVMIDTLTRHGAVVPGLAAVDTLIHERDGKLDATLDRSGISGVQTPQGFHARLLLQAHRYAESRGFQSSDDGSLVFAMGEPVKTIPGERTNIKVTYEDDVRMAEAILAMQKRS